MIATPSVARSRHLWVKIRMAKRVADIILASIGLILCSPILLGAMLAVWLQDRHSPFYRAPRAGLNGQPFTMLKLRSMVVNADKSGVASTSSNDSRITAVGRFIRKFKLDEVSQLINVLRGDMSMVGPRPNLLREIERYTPEEKHLLSVRPGITDISSIVFADEGEILKGSENPDLDYDQLIRPWKSRLGLLYIEKRNLALDLELVFITALAILSRATALKQVARILERLGADPALREVSRREKELSPSFPPGASAISSCG